VVSLVYTLKVNGEVIDSSEENEPLQFIQGEGHIIPGLEGALYEMGIGESKNLVTALRQATEEEISHGHVHED